MRSLPRVPGRLLIAGALLTACHASSEGTTAGSAAPTATTTPAAPPSDAGKTMSTANSGASEHTVTAADMQSLLSGQDGVDLETVSRDGKPAAMRVFGVRPGSVAARLGAQNGDQIESVNDVPVSAAGATGQWAQMAARDGRLTIKGVRAGQPFTTVLRVEGR